MRRTLLVVAAGSALATFVSCTDDAAGPQAVLAGQFAVVPNFGALQGGIVEIARGRFVLTRIPGGAVAKDTVIPIPAAADSVDLSLSVPVLTPGETFNLTITLISSAGDTVFRGGPIVVTPGTSGTPVPVAVPFTYVGTGANAAGVRIVSPDTSTFTGEPVLLTAEAFDGASAAIPGTPIGWTSLDTGRVQVTADAQYRGAAVGGGQRGVARLVAALITGQKDTVLVSNQPLPTTITAESGTGQSARADSTLPQPLVARVTAGDGLGVRGVWVRFAVTSGAGSLSADSVLTDSAGRAGVQFTLARSFQPHVVTATTPRLGSATAPFAASLVFEPPDSLEIVAGDGQTAVAGSAVAVAPQVRVLDADGLPVPGVTVTFAVAGGGGVVAGGTPVTDTLGLAAVTSWTLGATVGPNTLTATVSSLIASFTAAGIAGPVTQLVLVSGDTQTDTAGATLALPLVVRAEDASGNPVAGATVTWSAGAGAVAPPSVATDANGLAQAAWTLGTTVGAQAATAALQGTAITVGFTATATPATPTRLAFSVEPSAVARLAAITPAVVVTAYDGFANVATQFTGNVVLSILNNPGGGTLGGTTTAAAVAGVATFSDLTVDRAGSGFTLLAAGTGVEADTSAAFDVIAVAATITWINPAGGNWSDAANWSAGYPPTGTDTAVIALDGTYTVALDLTTTVARLVVGGTTGVQTVAQGANTFTVTGTAAFGATTSYNLAGGSFSAAGFTNAGAMIWSGGTLGGSGTVATSGTLTLSGGGTKTLGAGVTLANTGTLAIAGGTLAVTGGFTHAAGAVLQGSGTLDLSGATAVTLDGVINPGTSPGVLTIVGAVSLGGSAVVNVEWGGTTPGTTVDQLRFTSGPGTLGGALNVTLVGPYVPAGGERVPIVVGKAGGFATVSLPPIGTPALALESSNDTLFVAAAAPASFTVAGWSTNRSASFSLAGGAFMGQARASLATAFPDAALVGVDALSSATLAGVDVLVIGGNADNATPIIPLSQTEQTALTDFITGGACVVLLAENSSNGLANASLLNPVGMAADGLINGLATATVPYPSLSPVTNGPFGAVSAFTQNYPGYLSDVGAGTVLATNALGPALAVIPTAGLAPGSGPVIVFSDENAFGDTEDLGYFASNENLFRNTIQACLDGVPGSAPPGINQWIPSSGLWSNPAKWSLGRVPIPGDTVELTQGLDYAVTMDVSATVAKLTIGGTGDVISLNIGDQTLTITDPGPDPGLDILPLGSIQVGNGGIVTERIRNQGSVRWAGTSATLGTGTVVSSGGWTVVGGQLTVNGEGAFDFQTSGLLRLENDATMIFDNGFLTYLGGTIEAGLGTGNGLAFTNGAELSLRANLALDSLVVVLANGRIQYFNGNETLTVGPDAGITMDGTILAEVSAIVANQGVIVANAGAANYFNETITNTASGVIAVNASGGPVTLGIAGSENFGVVSVLGDQPATLWVAGGGSTLTNRAGGTLTTSGNGAHVFDGILVNENGADVALGSALLLRRSAALDADHVNAGTIDVTGGNLTIDLWASGSSFTNQGAMNVTGGNVLVTMASTSPTFVNEGTITVESPRSFSVSNASNGAFTNAATGVLQGTGTFNLTGGSPTVSNLGTIAPGLSPGVLTWQGNLPMGGTSAIDIELGGTTLGTDYDQLGASGYQLTLNGALNVSLTNGFQPAVGDSFAIMTGVRSGAFATVNLPSPPPGVVLDTGSTLTTYYVIASAAAPPNLNSWTNPAGGFWGTAANWSKNAVPAASDSVVIALPGTYTVTIDAALNPTVDHLLLGDATGTQTLDLNGNDLAVTNTTTVETGGDLFVRSSLTGGLGTTNRGQLRLTSATLTGGLDNLGTVTARASTINGAISTTAGSTIRTEGSVTFSNGFVNNGLLEFGGDGTAGFVTIAGGSGTIVNAVGGTITSIAAAGSTINRVIGGIDNQGLIQVLEVLLNPQPSFTNSGTIDITGADLVPIASGTVTNSGSITVASGREFRLQGGTLDLATGTITGNGTLAFQGGALATSSTLVVGPSGIATFRPSGAALSGTGSIVVESGGTLLFNTTNAGVPIVNGGLITVSGSSTVSSSLVNSGGTLDVSTGVLSMTAGFTHSFGATLLGNGTLDLSAATVGGFEGAVNPGTSPGRLTIAGPLTYGTGATVNIELGGTTPATGYDQLVHTGAITLNGQLVVDTAGFVPTSGERFAIMTFPSRTGTFTGVTLPTIPGVALDTVWAVAGTTDTLFIAASLGLCGGTPNSLPVVTVSLGSRCTSPDSVPTVAEALSLVQPGGIVRLESGAGTHSIGILSVAKPVTFQSGDAGSPAVNGQFLVNNLAAGTATFTGLTFVGSSVNVMVSGIYDQVVVDNSTFIVGGTAGVQVQSSTVPGAKVTVSNNAFSFSGGLLAVFGASAPNTQIEVLGNTVTGPTGAFGVLQFQGGATGRIEGNVVTGCAGTGSPGCMNVYQAAGVVVTGNTLSATPGTAGKAIRVNLTGATGASITNNTIAGGFSGGAPTDAASYGFTVAGIELTGTGDGTQVISGNTITGAATGILGASVAGTLSAAQDNVVDVVRTGFSALPTTMVFTDNDVTNYVNPFGTGFVGGQLACNWWGNVAGPQNVPGGTDPAVYAPWATGPIANGAGGQCDGVPAVPRIVFAGDSVGGLSSGIFSVNPDGTGQFQITTEGPPAELNVHPRWSPDRSVITYSARQPGNPNQLHIRTADGQVVYHLTSLSDTSTFRPRYSPDGKRLAFACGDGGYPNSAQDVCAIADVTNPFDGMGDGAGKTYVTDAVGSGTLGGSGAFAWNPFNSDQLAVSRDTVNGQGQTGSQIFLVNFDGTNVIPLTTTPILEGGNGVAVYDMDWAPDGSFIAFEGVTLATGERAIFRVELSDGTVTKLTTPGQVFGADFHPVVSPNSGQILFGRTSDGWQLMQVPSSGGGEFPMTPLLNFGIDQGGWDWSPDGSEIVLTEDVTTLSVLISKILPTTTSGSFSTDVKPVGRRANQFEVQDRQPTWRP